MLISQKKKLACHLTSVLSLLAIACLVAMILFGIHAFRPPRQEPYKVRYSACYLHGQNLSLTVANSIMFSSCYQLVYTVSTTAGYWQLLLIKVFCQLKSVSSLPCDRVSFPTLRLNWPTNRQVKLIPTKLIFSVTSNQHLTFLIQKVFLRLCKKKVKKVCVQNTRCTVLGETMNGTMNCTCMKDKDKKESNPGCESSYPCVIIQVFYLVDNGTVSWNHFTKKLKK